MAKMELGKSVIREDGLAQSSFDLRDIHFQDDSLVIHTLQGNIVTLSASAFTTFLDSLRAAVKAALIAPPAPAPVTKPPALEPKDK